MRAVLDALSCRGNRNRVLVETMPGSDGRVERITYAQMQGHVGRLVSELASLHLKPGTSVGLVAGNTPEWIAADLALFDSALIEVPVPLAFSAEQAAALLAETCLLLVDEQGLAALQRWKLLDGAAIHKIRCRSGGHSDARRDLDHRPGDPALAPLRDRNHHSTEVAKVIHTSGTTGLPKGIKVRSTGLDATINAMRSATPVEAWRRYLSLVPFSLLIEQITGVYLPAVNGGTIVLPPAGAALLGTAGSSADNALEWIDQARPAAVVLPPAAVSALAKLVGSGETPNWSPVHGRAPYLLAGGAPVSREEIERLDAAGLRVFEGYGLSENGSVVALNTPAAWRPGTVGRPLPHCEVKLSDEGELLVKSASLFAGYTVEDPTSRPVDDAGWLHTGDRAAIDDDGFITIMGRLKNMIITAHARNVSPEWVEGRLRAAPNVVDAVVFGDGLEHLAGLLVVKPGADPALAERTVRQIAEATLAETDRPSTYVVVPDTVDLRTQYFTVTGRPRRPLIFDQLVAPTLA